ncbi:MAG TPA: 7TM diverse intracellular signaling domain-containing protein [Polyangiaceae bacterium]
MPRLAFAASGQLVVDEKALTGETLGQRIDVFEDPSGNLSIAEVASPAFAQRFRPSKDAIPAFGLTKSAYWVRFVVTNPTREARPWLLELGYPPIDDVRLYVPRASGGFEERRTGDKLPFAEREIVYRNFLFSLREPPGARTYYLRAHTSGSITLPLHAWTNKAFVENLTVAQPPLWIFYGLMLVMAAYNLFVFLSIRQAAYLYYVCYIVSYVGFQFSLNGLAFQFLWPNNTWLNGGALTLCISLALGFGLLFQREFLGSRQWLPRLDRYAKFATVVTFVLAPASLVVDYSLAIRVIVIWGMHVIVLVVVTAIAAASKGYRAAYFYLAAWIVLLLGIFVYFLRTLGVLPGSFFTEWGLQLGAAIEVTLLSLGLADRINVMRSELQILNRQLTVNVEQLSTALEQAEAATRAKGEFLASVSHELRTPLNAIINIPEGLLEDFQQAAAARCTQCQSTFALESGEQLDASLSCPECRAEGTLEAHQAWLYQGDPENTARHLGYIHKSSKHLLDVVSSILDVSKLEAGRMDLNLCDVDLAELVSNTVLPLEQHARAAGVALELAPAPENAHVRADRIKVAQVVLNLVGNAIKFSAGRGRIRIELEDAAESWIIHVRDQGIGIAEHDRARIFESFTQVDSSNTRSFGGTGLGLAISKKLVELHDGEIWVESEIGHGSTFNVRLPKVGPAVNRAATAATGSAEFAAERSLRPLRSSARPAAQDSGMSP